MREAAEQLSKLDKPEECGLDAFPWKLEGTARSCPQYFSFVSRRPYRDHQIALFESAI